MELTLACVWSDVSLMHAASPQAHTAQGQSHGESASMIRQPLPQACGSYSMLQLFKACMEIMQILGGLHAMQKGGDKDVHGLSSPRMERSAFQDLAEVVHRDSHMLVRLVRQE